MDIILLDLALLAPEISMISQLPLCKDVPVANS